MFGENSDRWLLDPSVSITPQIYRILRERIIRNDLKPGDRISESDIARAYDVSRQPVREAFIKLADQGLIAVRPQRGTIVNRIAYSAVLDARFVREAIEADIVRLLAENPDPALLSDLRRQLERQTRTTDMNPLDFVEADEVFHRTLAEGAGKGSAWKLIEGLKSQMDRVRFLSLSRTPIKRLVKQHTAIVAMIAAGDVNRAEEAIRGHLREVLRDLPRIVSDNPDFFEVPVTENEGRTPRPTQGGSLK